VWPLHLVILTMFYGHMYFTEDFHTGVRVELQKSAVQDKVSSLLSLLHTRRHRSRVVTQLLFFIS
jgi:hypothetical protein